jgi:hypothetical protein
MGIEIADFYLYHGASASAAMLLRDYTDLAEGGGSGAVKTASLTIGMEELAVSVGGSKDSVRPPHFGQRLSLPTSECKQARQRYHFCWSFSTDGHTACLMIAIAIVLQ